jgi:hypothetical protein
MLDLIDRKRARLKKSDAKRAEAKAALDTAVAARLPTQRKGSRLKVLYDRTHDTPPLVTGKRRK